MAARAFLRCERARICASRHKKRKGLVQRERGRPEGEEKGDRERESKGETEREGEREKAEEKRDEGYARGKKEARENSARIILPRYNRRSVDRT